MSNSNFVSFFDNGFTFPGNHPIDDQHVPGIPKMADLNEEKDAFLAFKYKTVSGTGKLLIKLNDVQITSIPFGSSDPEVARVWYETIKGDLGILHKPPKHNAIVVEVHDDHDHAVADDAASPKVHVSDFKIFYHT